MVTMQATTTIAGPDIKIQGQGSLYQGLVSSRTRAERMLTPYWGI